MAPSSPFAKSALHSANALSQNKATQNALLWFGMIVMSIHLVFLSIIYYYFQQMEKTQCVCALTPDYKLLKNVNIALLVYVVFALVVMLLTRWTGVILPAPIRVLFAILKLAMFVLVVIFLILSLKYLLRLYKSPCACSEKPTRITYLFYVLLRLIWIAMSILFFIVFLGVFSWKLRSAR